MSMINLRKVLLCLLCISTVAKPKKSAKANTDAANTSNAANTVNKFNMSPADLAQERLKNAGPLQQRLVAFWKAHTKSDFGTIFTALVKKSNEANSERIVLNRLSRYISKKILVLCLGNKFTGPTADKSVDPTRVLTDEEISILMNTKIDDFKNDPAQEDKSNKGIMIVDTMIDALPAKLKDAAFEHLMIVIPQHNSLQFTTRTYCAKIILDTIQDLRTVNIQKSYVATAVVISDDVNKQDQTYRSAMKLINQRYNTASKAQTQAANTPAVVNTPAAQPTVQATKADNKKNLRS